jgi:pimeloyl-ACP methyl ester carboxylesterase
VKVVLICGILDEPRKSPMWEHLSRAFTRQYGGPVFVERVWYHFYLRARMRDFCGEIVRRHDTGEPIVLCGHSAGGAIALAAVSAFRRTPVVGVVAVFSPLRAPYDYLSVCGIDVPAVPLVTFGARTDIIVPHPFTRHRYSLAHKIVPTDHQEGLINDPRVANIIARFSARHIPPGSS